MLPIRGAFHSQLASIAQITISFTHVSRKIYRDSKTLTHRFEHEPNNFGYQRESIRVKYGWTESTRLEEHSRTVSNSIKGAQSQIKPFERNSRLDIYIRAPAPIIRVQRTEPVNFRQLATHIRCSRASRTRSKLHGKAIANRDTARIVELPFSKPAPTVFSQYHLFPFFLLPPEIPTLDPFIFFPSASLRTASPVSEPV